MIASLRAETSSRVDGCTPTARHHCDAARPSHRCRNKPQHDQFNVALSFRDGRTKCAIIGTILSVTYDVTAEAREHWGGAQSFARRWEPGRRALYTLCAGSSHDDVELTISKLWLIGRSHSAALERTHVGRKGDVYLDAATRLREARLDNTLAALASARADYHQPHRDALAECVAKVTNILMQVTEQEKVSLASKYLHYHQPAIPIYDSISEAAFKALASAVTTRGMDVYPAHLARFEHIFATLRDVNEFDPVTARTIDDFVLWWWQPGPAEGA